MNTRRRSDEEHLLRGVNPQRPPSEATLEDPDPARQEKNSSDRRPPHHDAGID